MGFLLAGLPAGTAAAAEPFRTGEAVGIADGAADGATAVRAGDADGAAGLA